ncbi:MAG TPA: IS200/IS605 family transposase [Syntrophales bacterium]|nr:IS200/IS605 family transposase [Syntrophales bacterium]HQM30759.1 IS200/IS605 family transposase [Syntrophales bacterium]
MGKSSEIRSGRHCVFNLHVHLVFVTKYRKRVFEKDHYVTMETIFKKVCKDFDAELIEVDGESDHVHLLISYPPKVSVSKLVNSLKGVSARLLKKHHPHLCPWYWKDVLWSPSYFAASCGGAPISIIRQYIEQQETPD